MVKQGHSSPTEKKEVQHVECKASSLGGVTLLDLQREGESRKRWEKGAAGPTIFIHASSNTVQLGRSSSSKQHPASPWPTTRPRSRSKQLRSSRSLQVQQLGGSVQLSRSISVQHKQLGEQTDGSRGPWKLSGVLILFGDGSGVKEGTHGHHFPSSGARRKYTVQKQAGPAAVKTWCLRVWRCTKKQPSSTHLRASRGSWSRGMGEKRACVGAARSTLVEEVGGVRKRGEGKKQQHMISNGEKK
ncbi:uncharacterized protein LOC128196239 [Vigna angularis]|uniref:uncharacterized protein LOC128196239 n=1 Tax=Phaseolus angularis TaxID=3914 RepID=UPI0022B33BB9|nr:uncharacterized protein LOC128196239 [Vigna angularis]